jgi:hypothetical protein
MSAADAIKKLETRAEWIMLGKLFAPWIVLAAIILLVVKSCHAPPPNPLPAVIAAKVEQHAIASAVDSSELRRLATVAAKALATKDSALRIAKASEVLAVLEHRRADSLAALAVVAPTAHDSAADYHAAYDARTVEADSLRSTIHEQDAALQALAVVVAAKDSSLTRLSQHAARADSIVASAVAALRVSDPPCRLARFFACPSRSATAIGGTILGAVAAGLIIKR